MLWFLFYHCFFCKHSIITNTHSGLKSLFFLHLLKKEKWMWNGGRRYRLFNRRQSGDYHHLLIWPKRSFFHLFTSERVRVNNFKIDKRIAFLFSRLLLSNPSLLRRTLVPKYKRGAVYAAPGFIQNIMQRFPFAGKGSESLHCFTSITRLLLISFHCFCYLYFNFKSFVQ